MIDVPTHGVGNSVSSEPITTGNMQPKSPSKLIFEHFSWQRCVLGYFLRRAFKVTVLVTFLRMLSEFAQVFALLIPLKILMMLGTENIPRAVRWFVTAETRDMWIIALTVATVVMYISSIMLNVISRRLNTRGTKQLFLEEWANSQITVKNRKKMSRLYVDVCSVYVYTVVFIMFVFVISLLMPEILGIIVVLIVSQLFFTDIVFKLNYGVIGWLRNAIIKNTKEYVKYSTSFCFIMIFLTLVLISVTTADFEVISAILSLLLARRAFGAFNKFANGSMRIDAKYRNDVDVLQIIQGEPQDKEIL